MYEYAAQIADGHSWPGSWPGVVARTSTAPHSPPPPLTSSLPTSPPPDTPLMPNDPGLWGSQWSWKKPIRVRLILSSWDLNAINVFTSMLLWSSWFHLFTTLSEKKNFRTSVLQWCLTSFKSCPLVLLSMLISKKLMKNVIVVSSWKFYAFRQTETHLNSDGIEQ